MWWQQLLVIIFSEKVFQFLYVFIDCGAVTARKALPDAMAQVPFQDAGLQPLDCGACRAQLCQDFGAVALLLNHFLHARYLPADSV